MCLSSFTPRSGLDFVYLKSLKVGNALTYGEPCAVTSVMEGTASGSDIYDPINAFRRSAALLAGRLR
jgi:hypothetical protein